MLNSAIPMGPGPGAHAPLPLASHIWFQSDNVDEAYSWLNKTMMPLSLRLEAPPAARGLVNRASLGGIHFNLVRLAMRVCVEFCAIADSYVIYLPIHGELHATIDGARYAVRGSHGLIVSPDDPVLFDFARDAVGILVQVPRERIERHLRSLDGGGRLDTLRFRPEVDLRKSGGLACARLIEFMIDGLEKGLWKGSAIIGEMERAFMSALLATLSNNHSERLAAGPNRSNAAPFYVRRAQHFMHNNLEQPLTLAHLIQSSGVSGRTLQAGFQRWCGTTPLRHFKTLRLEEAHNALLCASPATARVTDIAARFGFFQFGRFAADYKELYGVLPSETLRRVREDRDCAIGS